MAEQKWLEAELNPSDIVLDWNNPRIEASEESSPEEIIQKLVAHEDIIKMAKDLISFGGLMPGERIIVCNEKNKVVVLEGNRRVCAIQLLLKPQLIPKHSANHFPKADDEIKKVLKSIKADVAPNRDAAEPTITKRHTEPGIEKWNTVAKMRRAARLLEQGLTLDEISVKLGATKPALRKSIREYRLLKYAIDLKGWKPSERAVLTSNNLATNPYTRFFELKDVKQKLKLTFDENGNVLSSLQKKDFEEYMAHIARLFLIPDSKTRKPIANTRTTPDEVFEGKKAGKKKAKKAVIKPAKPSVFFENLVCTVQDQNLILFCNEIKHIDYTQFPLAASMLLRGVLECALRYQLRKSKKLGDLQRGKHDIGLEDMIKYCGNSGNEVFKEKRACDLLLTFLKEGFKDSLDFVIHSKWQEADPTHLEKAAKKLRPLMSYIVDENITDVEEESPDAD